MRKLIRKLLGIYPGEEFRTLLMFSYIFLVIASLMIIKPARNAMFLTYIGIDKLPYAFIVVAVAAAGVIYLYSKIMNRFRLSRLIGFTIGFSIVSLVVFWYLLSIQFKAVWFYYLFYVWASLYGVITTSQFWLLANYVFNAREAKRLFGIIGAGAISGGIAGGYLTRWLAPILGTSNMLFFCIGFLLLCSVIMIIVWSKGGRYHYNAHLAYEKRTQKKETFHTPFELFKQSRHLAYIAAIVGVSVIVANLVDFQFSAIASESIQDKDKLAAFFGFWLSNLSVASLLIQLLLTGRVLKVLGVTASLFFLPAGILLGAFCILVAPVLWSAIVIKVSDGGFKQSINKAGMELLALPLPSMVKIQGKAFIDIFIDSLATGLGGFLLLIFTSWLGLQTRHVSFVIIGFVLVWFILVIKVRSAYLNSFRMALEERSIRLKDLTINVDDVSVLKSLAGVLEGTNERQILYVLQLLENASHKQFIPSLKKLLQNPSDEIKIMALRNIAHYNFDDFAEEVPLLVFHQRFDVVVEAMTICLNETEDKAGLLNFYLESDSLQIRSAALLCAAIENGKNKVFKRNHDMVRMFREHIGKCDKSDCTCEEQLFMKQNMARVIGYAGEPSLYGHLKDLMTDTDEQVVQIAIENMGKTGDPQFIAELIDFLRLNRYRQFSRDALACYGNDILYILEDYLVNPEIIKRIRLAIPQVIARVGTQKSVNSLVKCLNLSDFKLNFEVVKALNYMRKHFPLFRFPSQKILVRIYQEVDEFEQRCFQLQRLKHFPEIQSTTDPAVMLFIKAFEEQLAYSLEMIFRMMGLMYDPLDMYSAYRGIVSPYADIKAKGVEFLDNILMPELKKKIVPLVESDGASDIHEKDETLEGILLSLLQSSNAWVKSCALFCLSRLRIVSTEELLKKIPQDDEPLVKETVQHLRLRLQGNG